MNLKFRKILLTAIGIPLLAGITTHASAIGVANLGIVSGTPLVFNGTGSPHGWDGNNNSHFGWTHNSEWMAFSISATTSIEIKSEAKPVLAGEQNTFIPGFTVWSTSSSGFNGSHHDPNYAYTGRTKDDDTAPTHPYNVVKGAPTNLSGQQSDDPLCQAGGCNSNNWLAPGGGDTAPHSTDGITYLLGYANAGPIDWNNGNGDKVGSGIVGRDNKGKLTGLVSVQSPNFTPPNNTIQYASLKLYNLSPGTYLIVSGGSCHTDSACALIPGSIKKTFYKISISQISTPALLSISNTNPEGGTVTSDKGGINCGVTCSQNYDSGTKVILTATPLNGFSFTGWSGSCAGISPTCTLSMTAAKTVKANFVWLQKPSWKYLLK